MITAYRASTFDREGAFVVLLTIVNRGFLA